MRFKRWTQSARPMDHRVWQARAWRLTRAIYTLQGCPSRGTKNNSRRWVYIGTPLLSASIDSRIETTVLEARQGESTRPYWNSAKIRGIFSIRLIPRQLGHPNWLTQVGSPTLFSVYIHFCSVVHTFLLCTQGTAERVYPLLHLYRAR